MAIPSVPQTPTNPNLMPPNKFLLVVDSMPDVQFWCQTVNLPGISVGEAPRQTPFIDLYNAGDKCIMNPFSITFLVDEDLRSWLNVFNWMMGLTFPKDFKQYANLDKRFGSWKANFPQYSDLTLSLMNAQNNPNFRIRYYNAFPVSLSDLLFSTTSSPEESITADVTFRYDLFEVVKV